jgi:threonylcarbamoyladenosine tRNA methylthiotransferase MtaB
MGIKVAVATLGCKVNQAESLELAEKLSQQYQLVDSSAKADVYLINTCSVTAEAEHKSRQLLSRARRLNPNALLVITGCYGEISRDRLLKLGADLVVSNQEKDKLVKLIESNIPSTQTETESSTAKSSAPANKHLSRIPVKVQDGCDQFCSYCLIPYARGRQRSLSIPKVIKKINHLVDQGVSEVILTGVHLGKYGYDKQDRSSLVILLKAILAETLVPRLRLSSIEATEVSSELLDLISRQPRIARHLHLPLQSGDNQILKAMNRPYTVREFQKIVDDCRQTVPSLAITTDVMVGFPGETDKQFVHTYEAVKQIAFSKLHVFKYSKRPLTTSAKIGLEVSEEVKRNRSLKLRNLGSLLERKFAESFLGTTQEVVTESVINGWVKGRTSHYLPVLVRNNPKDLSKKIVLVRINSYKNNQLYGEFIS